MKRLDVWLTELKLAPSRAKAQEMIQEGCVRVKSHGAWKIVDQPAKKFSSLTKDEVEITSHELLKYVARSGLKLESALSQIGLKVTGLTCLDVGQSTGGFTDCLLQHGAERVVGLDVGSDQLDEKMRNHTQVQSFENLHAKDLKQHPFFQNALGKFDLAVIDVSFISVTKIFAEIVPFVRAHGHFIVLVKPQFELGAHALNKRGVVDSPQLLAQLELTIKEFMKPFAFRHSQYFASGVKGRDGNQEFFYYAQKN